MSDTNQGDEGEGNSPRGKTLSLKRTVESGQVRQSFSHGRSKSVVVERRRKRTVKPGSTEEQAVVEAAPAPEAPAPVQEAVNVPDGLSKAEQEKRLAAVAEAKVRAVEEAKQAEIDAPSCRGRCPPRRGRGAKSSRRSQPR
jgi:translation initiation factor IF-2